MGLGKKLKVGAIALLIAGSIVLPIMHQRAEHAKLQDPLEKVSKSESFAQRVKKYNTEILAGVILPSYAPNYLSSNEAKESMKEIRATGANSIEFHSIIYQDNKNSSEVYKDPKMTSTHRSIADAVIEARKLGFDSIDYSPIINIKHEQKGDWRGLIQPANIDEWFKSFESFIIPEAEFSQKMGIESLTIASEYSKLFDENPERWIKVIKDVRKVYSGNVGMSFNFDNYSSVPSGIVDNLDYLGVNAYFSLNNPEDPQANQSEKELAQRWEPYVKKLNLWINKFDKPFVVTEWGYPNLRDADVSPWEFTLDGRSQDNELQQNLFESFFKVFHPGGMVSKFKGSYMFSWYKDTPYFPQGPALAVLKKEFSEINKYNKNAQ